MRLAWPMQRLAGDSTGDTHGQPIDPTGGGLPPHFAALREPEHAYEFPCDAHGRVDLDGLSRRTFNDYLFARALVGWVFGVPSVHSA